MSFIVIYIYIHSTFTDRVSGTFGLVCLCVIFLRLNKEYSMAVYCTHQSGQSDAKGMQTAASSIIMIKNKNLRFVFCEKEITMDL